MPLILLNKPFRTLCQFSDADGRATLGDFVTVTKVYPAGRLDFDSEGLVVLTDDGRMQSAISEPRNKLAKVYWAQVEGLPGQRAIDKLTGGVPLKDGPAQATTAALIEEPASLWARSPPIRVRRNKPARWLEIVLQEGRNRQVRRMCAAAGYPVLRLVRQRIGPWELGALRPGEWTEIDNRSAWRQLRATQVRPAGTCTDRR